METEKKLIKKLYTENQEAFKEIYDAYSRLVSFIIYQIVRDKSVVEELVQDTFMKVWKNIHSFEVNTNFQAWLVTIAKNCSRDYLKAKKNVEVSDDLEIISNYLSKQRLYEFYMEVKEILTELEYDVIVLTMVCNMKRREIAGYLEKPLGTILRTYHSAILKLRGHFKVKKFD